VGVEAWLNGGPVPDVLVALDYRNVLPVVESVAVKPKPTEKQRGFWE
jgi:hypothetical protein